MASNSVRRSVLVVQASTSKTETLRELLHAQGFSVHAASQFAEAAALAAQLKNITVLIDAGDNLDETKRVAKSLAQDAALSSYPLVFVGRDAEGARLLLEKIVTRLRVVNRPCPWSHVIEGILSIDLKPNERGSYVEHGLYRSRSSISELVFSLLRQYGLSDKVLGGAHYPRIYEGGETSMEVLGFVPSQIILAEIENFGRWGAAHHIRAAYLTGAMVRALKLEKQMCEYAMSGAILFGSGFVGRSRDLLWVDYLRDADSDSRKDIVSRLKDSAMKVTAELDQPNIGSLISLAAKQLGGEEPVTDEPMSLAAGAIIAADYFDRLCFQGGYWSSMNAYFLMRRINRGSLTIFHPLIIAILAKFLSEAIITQTPRPMLPPDKRKDPAIYESAELRGSSELDSKEARVSLDSLEPGMRLSRPLSTFDGRLLLEEDVALDEDLISRIWQLAAIRPLDTPIIKKNSDASEQLPEQNSDHELVDDSTV